MKKTTLILLTMSICAATFYWLDTHSGTSPTPLNNWTQGCANLRTHTTNQKSDDSWLFSPTQVALYNSQINYHATQPTNYNTTTYATSASYKPLTITTSTFGNTPSLQGEKSNINTRSFGNSAGTTPTFGTIFSQKREKNSTATASKLVAQSTPTTQSTYNQYATQYTAPFGPMFAPPPVINPGDPEPETPDIGIEDVVDDGHGIDLCPIGSEICLMIFAIMYLIFKLVRKKIKILRQ